MLFLAIFGKNVEDAFGPLLYLVLYFAAMMTETAMTLLFGTAQDARLPELGASAHAGQVAPEIDCLHHVTPAGSFPGATAEAA